jgi:hypothetical protein
MYECFLALRYLYTHPRRAFEATVLLAYSYLKDLEEQSPDSAFVAQRAEILSRMPSDAVEAARARMAKRPYTWTGLSLRVVAANAGVGGYEEFYGPMSGVAHAARAGRYFRLGANPDGTWRVMTGWNLEHDEREVQANFARRILHASFKSMWELQGGGSLAFDTTDPFAWTGIADSGTDADPPPSAT